MKFKGAILESFDFIKQHEGQLTHQSREFISSLHKHYRKHHTLSDKQMQCMNDIKQTIKTS